MRLLIYFLWLLFIGYTCLGQSGSSDEPKVFSGGLILGCNFTQVDGDTYFGYHKLGLNAGGVVYVHFTEKLGASMELLYSQKGSRGEDIAWSPAFGNFVAKYFMDLNYVEVPLTLHYIYHDYDIEAGISYARLITSDEWIQSDRYVIIDPELNRFNTSDLNYIFGATHKLYQKLYINARFQYSIIPMRPMDRVPSGFGYANAGQFNNLLNLRLLYMF